MERAHHDRSRQVEGFLQGRLRLGCPGPGPAGRASGLHGVEAGRQLGRRHDAENGRDARRDAAQFRGVYFVVSDTDATVAKAKELGGTVFMGPADIEPGRFAVIADNIGAVFNVLALKAEEASAG